MPDEPIKFCDLQCKYAEFPKTDDVDGSRSCRTFIALYCKKKRSLVHKNLPCNEKVEAQSKAKSKTSSKTRAKKTARKKLS